MSFNKNSDVSGEFIFHVEIIGNFSVLVGYNIYAPVDGLPQERGIGHTHGV